MVKLLVLFVKKRNGKQGARRKKNSVIFLNRKILPDPEDERTCLTWFDDNGGFPWNLKKYSIDNDYLRNTAVKFDLFFCVFFFLGGGN